MCAAAPANNDAAAGSVTELARIIGQIRQRWPDVRINIRGDSGFCREEIMGWCEANGVGYLLGLARNQRLEKRIAKALRKSRRRHVQTGLAARRFRELRLSHPRELVAHPAGGRQGRVPGQGRQPALRGHQPGRQDRGRPSPV